MDNSVRSLKNLVYILIAIVLVLGALNVMQLREIGELTEKLATLSKDLLEMNKEARSAVGNVMPELDARLTRVETTMNGMDTKIQQAEDHFVQRLNTELPRMLDSYLKTLPKKVEKQMDSPLPN
jgi:hypothetical protein